MEAVVGIARRDAGVFQRGLQELLFDAFSTLLEVSCDSLVLIFIPEQAVVLELASVFSPQDISVIQESSLNRFFLHQQSQLISVADVFKEVQVPCQQVDQFGPQLSILIA